MSGSPDVESRSSVSAVDLVQYLDTSVIASAVIPGAAHHAITRSFCDLLIQQNVRVVFSELHTIELMQAFVGIANDPTQLSGSARRRYRLHRWGILNLFENIG